MEASWSSFGHVTQAQRLGSKTVADWAYVGRTVGRVSRTMRQSKARQPSGALAAIQDGGHSAALDKGTGQLQSSQPSSFLTAANG